MLKQGQGHPELCQTGQRKVIREVSICSQYLYDIYLGRIGGTEGHLDQSKSVFSAIIHSEGGENVRRYSCLQSVKYLHVDSCRQLVRVHH